jgi:hypothetical protein
MEMYKKDLEQEFYQQFGYFPDERDLQDFMEEYGVYDYNPYPHSANQHRSNSCTIETINKNNDNDLLVDFKGILSEIGRSVKKGSSKVAENEILTELAFMSLVFMTKASLYFLVRYCHEHGYSTDL